MPTGLFGHAIEGGLNREAKTRQALADAAGHLRIVFQFLSQHFKGALG